ncbi:MAG: hypothetical protein FK732_09545 [Asgard group archaeon]|nr:hypothetical protein [Asgard group archaeon]
MKEEQIIKENSSAEKNLKIPPVLYRIHSDKRDYTNIILKKISQEFTSYDFFSEYKSIKEIPVWNQMRENTFKIIEEEFLQTIIKKGLKKETHKEIIQNNHDDYIRFFQRKIRYLISDLTFDARFNEHITNFNGEMMSEILLNLETEKEILLDSLNLSDFINKVNNNISLTYVKFFSRKIAVFLTSKEPYRTIILDYFREFFHYLVVF